MISCKDFKNPAGPEPIEPPKDNQPSEVTVEYNGTPVAATIDKYQLTLNWVKIEEKLKDYTQEKWFYPYFRYFLVMEVKCRNTGAGNGLSLGFVTNMFKIVDRNNATYWPRTTIACSCFYNALMYYEIEAGQESPPAIVVFDVPDPKNGLVLVFSNTPVEELIKFRIYFKLNL